MRPIFSLSLSDFNLVPLFEKVWEESSGESLLQIQLLIALKNFVVALGYQSPSCYSMLLPILQKGIDINNPDELNLLEDSMLVSLRFILILELCFVILYFISYQYIFSLIMQLWEATLCHAPSMVPQLLAYFPCLVDIIERSFDHLQVRHIR